MAKLKDTQVDGNLSFTGELLNKDGINLETAFSNPNLLINSDFRNPINQRGASSYNSDTSWNMYYTIDRWAIQHGANMVVNSSSIKLTNTSGVNPSVFLQKLENPLPLDTYTLTINVASIVNIPFVQLADGDGNFHTLDLKQGKNVLTLTTKVASVEFAIDANQELEIEWVKLEQGSIATPFVPRPYGEELALCQRYYQVISSLYLYCNEYNGSISYFNGIVLATPMRTIPTATFNEGFAVIQNAKEIAYFGCNGQKSGMYFTGFLDAEIY